MFFAGVCDAFEDFVTFFLRRLLSLPLPLLSLSLVLVQFVSGSGVAARSRLFFHLQLLPSLICSGAVTYFSLFPVLTAIGCLHQRISFLNFLSEVPMRGPVPTTSSAKVRPCQHKM